MNRSTHQLSLNSFSRRQLLAAGMLGATGLALTACAGGPSTTSAGSTPSHGAKRLDFDGVKPAKSIQFWTTHPGASLAVETAIVNAFNASQNQVKVTMVTAGANYQDVATKFQTAQAGGSLPGVLTLSDVWWFPYKLSNSIIPLDSLLQHVGLNTDDYVTSLYNDYSYQGEHWASPYARSTALFYYNRSAWKKAGLPDRGPKTWDEFAGWAKRLKSADVSPRSPFEFNAVPDGVAWLDQNIFWSMSAEYSNKWDITCNSTKAIQAADWMQNAIYVDKWATVTSNNAVADLGAGATCAALGTTGNLITTLAAASGKFDVGVSFVPGDPTDASAPVCPSGGTGLSVPSGITPEEQVAAGMFIKYATNPSNTVKFSRATGYMPVRKSADVATLIKAQPLIDTAIRQLPHVRQQDWARVFLPGGDAVLMNALMAITTQQASPKEQLTSAKQQLETIYTKQVKPRLV